MGYLQFPDLKARGIPWSKQHIGRKEREGTFPLRVRLADGTVVWVAEEIDAYLAAKAATRDQDRLLVLHLVGFIRRLRAELDPLAISPSGDSAKGSPRN